MGTDRERAKESERETAVHTVKQKYAPDTTKMRVSDVERLIDEDGASDQTNQLSLEIYVTTKPIFYTVLTPYCVF